MCMQRRHDDEVEKVKIAKTEKKTIYVTNERKRNKNGGGGGGDDDGENYGPYRNTLITSVMMLQNLAVRCCKAYLFTLPFFIYEIHD